MPTIINVDQRILAEISGGDPSLTIVIKRNKSGGVSYLVPEDIDSGCRARIDDSLRYLKYLELIAPTGRRGGRAYESTLTVFQVGDCPEAIPSISWESKKKSSEITLIPDLYYYNEVGYSSFNPDFIPWSERDKVLFWRGATTGLPRLNSTTIQDLPRYQMCRACDNLGGISDVGFSNIVQAEEGEYDYLSSMLSDQRLMRPFVNMSDMNQKAFMIDIDGNSNSWNLIKKLKLGCCLFRVDSEWEQWLEPRLKPWEHFIPIAKDFSDIEKKLSYCLSNPDFSERIAKNGFDVAHSFLFEHEMARASDIIFCDSNI